MTLVSGLNIGKEIGRGHFGVVHEATDDVQGRVAVKVLSIKTGESQADWTTRKAAHLREAKHLASAAHQNIVQVFYNVQSEDDSSICYCMEFCEGGSAQTSY